MFNKLQTAFDTRRVEMQQTTAGIDPEQVLVIETIGSVENFARAVKCIDGLEWLGELEIDEIAPDDDFFDESKPDKSLNGRLYLVMTNQKALDEMLSLWRQYQADPNMQFVRGMTKFRDAFLHLKEIRRWDVQDRLSETGIIDIWRQDLKYDGDRMLRFEAELWFRENTAKRIISQQEVSNLVQQAGGQILGQCVLEDIAYHAILAELPANCVRTIIDDPTVELVKCDNIMFFRPVGQMSVGDQHIDGEIERGTVKDAPLPTGSSVVAILDGLPIENHLSLAGRLRIDDPDNWSEDYTASERIHGTSMASLIVRGDMNDSSAALARPVYLRPIMKPMKNCFITPRPECVPDDVLVVDLIHRAIKRMIEGDGEDGPVAPDVRVINLSFGDKSRQFINAMSPIARLIDWLSVKYNVLFIISAGNHCSQISLEIADDEFRALAPEDLEKITVKALYQDARHRRLLSPAESMNGITVGAVHFDSSNVVQVGNRIDPFGQLLPSPVSAFGSGYRRAIKPDILFVGGRQYYRPVMKSGPSTIEPAIHRIPPGNKVASPGTIEGELSATSYCCGTSNAAALISRSAGICYDSLIDILNDQLPAFNDDVCITPLLKAMLVHGCMWSDMGERLLSVIKDSEIGRKIVERANRLYSRSADIANEINRQHKKLLARWLGYGMPEIERVLNCTKQRASLLGFGQLSDSAAHVFRLPLPPSLGSRPEWRRLTVTLAWLSPLAVNTQKYRTASLWFEIKNSNLVPSRSDADWQAVRRGTVQHEVFEGEKAEPFIDGYAMEIKVNCRQEAGKIVSPVPYGMVVSLEVSEGIDIAVYDEIRTRIAPPIQIQQSNDVL
ncbi:MAG: S8 family peptidase [Armatimonadota bacterium]